MTSTVTPGGGKGPGPGPGNVYATTAPPLPPAVTAPAGAAPDALTGAAVSTAQTHLPSGSSVGTWLQEQFSGTPGRLRVAALACVLLGLLLGASGAYALQTKADGLDQAGRNLDQLVTVQQAYTALAEADSQATNLFLRGGLEDPAGRQIYLDRLDLAGRALSRASSGAQDLRSRTDLQTVHVALTRYAGLVEAARANNRQGFPIGVAYLKQASALLRTDVLPTLAAVQGRDQSAVEDALDRGRGGLLALVGGAVLLLLGLAQWWLFRTSRRILNLPLLTATAVGSVALLGVGLVLDAAATRTNQARTTDFRAVVTIAAARSAAFDAKSNESLTLIARGNGEQYEKAYQDQLARAETATAGAATADSAAFPLVDHLSDWAAMHQDIRRLDDIGQWDRAVELAVGTQAQPELGSNPVFARFDELSRQLLDEAVGRLDLELRRPVRQLRFAAVSLLLVGLLMALAGRSGVATRLREFR